MEFEHSDKVRKLQERVAAFMAEHVYPNEEDLFAQVSEGDRWQPVPLLEQLKARARAAELWNLFLPESEYGAGLTNLEYAPLCEIMGRSPWAPGLSGDVGSLLENCISAGNDLTHTCAMDLATRHRGKRHSVVSTHDAEMS
jgi:alkylation response protein AidB-like acyl-CoA dehydrogenase